MAVGGGGEGGGGLEGGASSAFETLELLLLSADSERGEEVKDGTRLGWNNPNTSLLLMSMVNPFSVMQGSRWLLMMERVEVGGRGVR